ncbi:MAG: alpha/beta hydrolase family protein [Flammeovirgaceae bacterium]
MKTLWSVLIVCFAASGVCAQVDYSINGKYTVSVMEFRNTTDTQRNRNIPIKVHYPLEKGQYPLIIISHGAGGDWDTHFALAHHLATQGYVVFCLEHIGSNTKMLKRTIRIFKNLHDMIHDGKEVLGRPQDVSFAIDQAISWNESIEPLKNKIDTQNIGVLGHSFGAYTSMVIAGMKPALDWLEPRAVYGNGLGKDAKDKRVKACVALSPQGVGEPFFKKESFYTLSTPLLGISGTEDKQQGGLPPINRYEAFEFWSSTGNNVFVWLTNAQHLDFTDSEGGETHGMKSKNRKEVQKVVRAATLMFFNQHLKNDALSKNQINTDGLKPYLSGKVNAVEVRSK